MDERHRRLEDAPRVTDAEMQRQPPRFDAREVEHFVDEAKQVLSAQANARDLSMLIVGERAADAELEQLRVADDGVERRAELVAHQREEFRFRVVRRFGFRSRRALVIELRDAFFVALCGRRRRAGDTSSALSPSHSVSTTRSSAVTG